MKILPAAIRAPIDALAARWRAMPLRDQRALAGLTLFFGLVIGWYGVVSPVMAYAENSKAAQERALADLIWMQANLHAARQASARAPQHVAGQSLLSAVNASARSSGLNLQRFEPEGDLRVRVTLENAVFTDVMRWIVVLEQQHGLTVENFNADQRGQPGIVNIRLTVGKPT
jgi:general secretion pathway protein M